VFSLVSLLFLMGKSCFMSVDAGFCSTSVSGRWQFSDTTRGSVVG
jgi:hypothetical protein